MKVIKLLPMVGVFAENKDIARDIRIKQIIPALSLDQDIVLDFKGIDSATQSFAHALISEVMRDFGNEVLERISFKNCNENVQKIISIVVEYMQI